MKKEIPKPVAIAIVAVIAVIALGMTIFKINPPPAKSPEEIGGGAPVEAGSQSYAPIGADGKPIEEDKK